MTQTDHRTDRRTETPAELFASRARLVAAADRARRALQQDLHDGAQQRLVHALILLKLTRGRVDAGSPVAGLVEEALANVDQANRDLRAVVHGLLPRSLSQGGLPGALQSLGADLPVPVELNVAVPRLPAEVEITAYLVAAEALDAVLPHACGQRISLDVGLEGDTLAVEIRHDGTGSAGVPTADRLTGVRDRVLAAGGSLVVTDRAGGVVVHARLPVSGTSTTTSTPTSARAP